MKNKVFLFSLFPFFCLANVQAQDNPSTDVIEKSKYLKIEFAGLGGSLNLSGSNSNLFSDRSNFGISSTLVRVTHLFSNKVGWYAGVNMNLFKEQKSPYYKNSFNDVIGDFAMSIFYGGYIPNPIIDAGIVYRIETKKWDINPRIGLGYGTFLVDRDSRKSKTLSDGKIEQTIYKQRSASTSINLGLGANYFFGKRSFAALNAGLQQPIAKSHATLTVLTDNVQTDFKENRTSNIGRDLSLTVGYGLLIGKRKVSY